MSGGLVLRTMTAADGPAVLSIYAEGIATGHATFESEPPTWDHFDTSRRAECRWVADDGDVGGKVGRDRLLGWAVVSPTSTRPVYAGVAEVGIYVATRARGRRVGDALLGRLVEDSEAHGLWTLQAGIFPENMASLALHARHGFRVLGRRKRVGLMRYGPMAGVWRDVLLLERRSRAVGL